MKKKWKLFSLLLLLGMIVTGCDNESTPEGEEVLLTYKDDHAITFAQDEYLIHSGDAVKVEQNFKGVTYQVLGANKDKVSLDEKSGVITFDDSVGNMAQVLYVASYKNYQTAPVVVTLLHEYESAEIFFRNLSDYILDGEFITAYASLPYAVTYRLKENVPGVSINSTTGKVAYTSNVQDGDEFTVIASSHNEAKSERTFKVMIKDFIGVENNRQVVEKDGSNDAIYVLDYGNQEEAKKEGVLALTDEQNRVIDPSYYTYDAASCSLKVHANYLNSIYEGENALKIITSRNAIAIEAVVATKFIYTASDLASINNSVEALEGYYVLMNDIDLSSYLSEGDEGYDDGKGWVPIGQYADVLDPNIAVKNAFKGTFDGNGHVVSNLLMDRKDVASFNAGLFGYVTSSSIIKNLGVSGSMDVSSYSGGLVGSNSGIISNCWADVDVTAYSGADNVYRYLGGLVGNNFGVIENCYALGNVLCDSYFGAFVGSNDGDIKNCYALKGKDSVSFSGFGLVDESCVLYEDESAMINRSWESDFSNKYWNFEEGKMPTLKVQVKETSVRQMRINREILNNDYYPNDKINLEVIIYPLDMQETYEKQVVFTVEKNGGVSIKDNVLNLFNVVNDEVIVHASLTVEGRTLEDTIKIYVGKKITSLTMITGTEVMKAGSRYRVGASYLPSDATEGIEYHLRGTTTSLKGVTIKDDIITISEDTECEEFEVYAMSVNGKKMSDPITIKVDPLHILESESIYPSEFNEFELNIDENVDLSDAKVTLFGKQVAYSIKDNKIVVSKDVIHDMKDIELVFQIILKDNTRYQKKVYVFSHQRYDNELVKSMYQDVIEIDSKEDFFTYFNIKVGSVYDQRKENNYDKVFMLTADIDFEGEEIYGIGYSLESGRSNKFVGKFFGCEHTISNVVIKQNESRLLLGDTSSSPYYGVGFFGALEGEVYDLNFEEIASSGKNFVGGVVGLMTGGRVENCHVSNTNASINASGQTSSGGDIYVDPIVGRRFGGIIVACDVNKNN